MGIKVYQVRYRSNPNLPIGYDHAGRISNLTSESTRTLESIDEAIEFWSQCTDPITELKEFKAGLCETCCLTEEEAEEILSICEEETLIQDEDLDTIPQGWFETHECEYE